MTTVIRSTGIHTIQVWRFLAEVSKVESNARLPKLEHPSGRVPVYIHSSLYRVFKLNFPLDVGGLCRDSRVTNELGTGSVKRAVVDSK